MQNWGIVRTCYIQLKVEEALKVKSKDEQGSGSSPGDEARRHLSASTGWGDRFAKEFRLREYTGLQIQE